MTSDGSNKLASALRRRLPALYLEQVWLIRLRWLAGLGAVGGGLYEWCYTHWYDQGLAVPLVGAGILIYNAVLWLLVRCNRETVGRWSQAFLRGLAWAQILLDLVCLTYLTVLTGGYQSPLRSLFVLHMVFASLLLPRAMAFAVCGTAIALLQGALALTGQWPRDAKSQLIGVGWGLTLLATVYLANRITRSLHAQERRLLRRHRRIRAMAVRLRRQQQALVQQEKMVALGQMAAGVAHEVANPLASMDGLLQLLERRPDRITPENLLRLREQIARIHQIVRQLTTFSHPGDAVWQTGSINDAVTRVLNVLRFDSRLYGVTVNCELDPQLPPCQLQPTSFDQVLVNLVVNALDALESSPQRILTIRTTTVEGLCRLEIHDTGVGIAPEHLRRLFEPFFTTKPVGKGTGLGLSISYSLVRKHGGTIRVQSQLGQGTTFIISLPCQSIPQSASQV